MNYSRLIQPGKERKNGELYKTRCITKGFRTRVVHVGGFV